MNNVQFKWTTLSVGEQIQAVSTCSSEQIKKVYFPCPNSVTYVGKLCHQESFQTLKNWVKELRQHGPPNIVVAIAGNKCDLSDARWTWIWDNLCNDCC